MDVHIGALRRVQCKGKSMKTFVNWLAHRWWLFVACLLAYVAVIGPELMSAARTSAVLVGIGLLVVLTAWGYVVLRRVLSHKE
jgi:hypothetical protein